MSQTELHKGKLVKILSDATKEDMITFANAVVKEEIPDYYTDIFEFMIDNDDKYPYYFGDNAIYELKDTELDGDEDIFEYKTDDDITEYTFKFYNGGTCLFEQVYKLINKLEKETK